MGFSFYRLLDRDQVGDEEATLDDDEDNGFLKAFKVVDLFNHYLYPQEQGL